MHVLLDPLQNAFMVRALIASALIGLTCSIVGVYVVLRNLAFDHLALAPTNCCHVDSDGTSHRAIVPAVTCELRDLGA